MSTSDYLSRFTPSRTDPAVLERIFVQREEMARDAEERIALGVTSKNKYHLLYVGPRGSGKTHLVSVLHYRLSQRADLADRLRIAWLSEDETTTSYLKFLLRIHRALHERHPTEFSAIDPRQIPSKDDGERTRIVERWLTERLAGRTLLVIVENLDMLMDGLGDSGQKAWRGFLQQQSVANTIATTQQLSPAVSSRTRAFYGFFNTIHLEPLDLNEAIELLTKIAEDVTHKPDLVTLLGTPKGHGRVKAIHHLTGGSHRLYVILSEFLTCESLDDLVRPFEQLVDELTPYYQERLRSLSPQQREIVEHLARAETTLAVKTIADDLMLTHQVVASQLKKLSEKGYVRNDRRGRESLFELAEPLMRICVEVKEVGRGPIRLFVEFLRRWFSEQELEDRLQCLPAGAETDRKYLQLALEDSRREAAKSVADTNLGPNSIALDSDPAEDRLSLAYSLLESGDPIAALDAFETSLTHDDKNPRAFFGRSLALGKLERWDEALQSSRRASEIEPNNSIYVLKISECLYRLSRFQAAFVHAERAAVIDPSNAFAWLFAGMFRSPEWSEESLEYIDKSLKIDTKFALGWWQRAENLSSLGRIEQALESYDRAVELDSSFDLAWHGRGNMLRHLNQTEFAIDSYTRAVAINPTLTRSWIALADALTSLNRIPEAIEVIERCINYVGKLSILVIKIGELHLRLGRPNEALDNYNCAVQLEPGQAWAWNRRSTVLEFLHRNEEALEGYDRALEIDPGHYWSWFSRGYLLGRLGRDEEAVQSYDRALAISPENSMLYSYRALALRKIGHESEANLSEERSREINRENFRAIIDHFQRGDWQEAQKALAADLKRFPPIARPDQTEVLDIILALLDTTRYLDIWLEQSRQAIQAFANVKSLKNLGDALVNSLVSIPERKLSVEALAAWRMAWVEAGAGREELRLPLRLFEVGMRYHETGDEGELLTLISQERSILAEKLGLNVKRLKPRRSKQGKSK